MIVVQSLHHPILCYTRNPYHNPKSHPPLLLRFKTSHLQNLKYLKKLNITPSSSNPENVEWILSIITFLKSKHFSDYDIPRLSSLIPFLSIDTLSPLFTFLYNDLSLSPQQSRACILKCPDLLTSNVNYKLKPTLSFLSELGTKNINPHLLNTPIERLVAKVEFLEDLGMSREEACGVCKRFPAIFGYNVEDNMRPKVEYLVYDMGREIEELKRFPQYFGFHLKRRIAPRHLWLKERKRRVSLMKMLILSDEKFYDKWK